MIFIMKQEKGILQRERLVEYIDKLENEEKMYSDLMEKLQQEYKKQAEVQVVLKFGKLKEEFKKLKKSTEQELLALKYSQQNPQEKNNVFALFNHIDQKLYFNSNIIQSTNFTVSLPYPSTHSLEEDINSNKLTLYQNYLTQLLSILKSDNIRKYCKKEAEASDKVVTIYQKLLENAKESLYCTQVKIKKIFEEGVSEVSQYKHLENLTLCLTNQKGIMNNNHYHQLINSLLPNRFFLTKVQLKIMDMQFTQQKCDILRKRLSTQFPSLRSLSIHNYYKECKLGMFEDFTWQPYRKKVHINSGVW